MSTATKARPEAAMAKKHKLTAPTDRTLHVERIFDAPRAKVWRAMTDVNLLAKWWGRGNKLDIEKYEFVKGGHWRFVEHSDHGDHGFEGRFREIAPPERLSMTFEWDGLPGHPIVQTMELKDLGDGRTNMITTSMFYTLEERNGMVDSGMEGGMTECYALLDALLTTL